MRETPQVPGFLAGGVASGVKKNGAKDLALIFCPAGASAAGVFTTNQVKAPPVVLARARTRRGVARAIVAVSGCANAYTGARGLADARMITGRAAELLGIAERDVLPASTGVIGVRLPVAGIGRALPGLVSCLSPWGWHDAAEAIMTTDTRPKIGSRWARLPEGHVRIVGIAKGAGMIEPHMATLLVFLATNARVDASLLRAALREACDASFNRMTIDGAMSTNDTAILLASGVECRSAISSESPSARRFSGMLTELCMALAEGAVADGEGATKTVGIQVSGARSDKQARDAAYAVANSMLVKTALGAADPNWGRIVQALGASPAKLDPERLSLRIGDAAIVRRGCYTGEVQEEKARQIMRRPAYEIRVDLGVGRGKGEVLTCDLTEEYVRVNASYRS
jgi:glutamate N-acetyltransferase/amino-acid N-acetyltransferase